MKDIIISISVNKEDELLIDNKPFREWVIDSYNVNVTDVLLECHHVYIPDILNICVEYFEAFKNNRKELNVYSRKRMRNVLNIYKQVNDLEEQPLYKDNRITEDDMFRYGFSYNPKKF